MCIRDSTRPVAGGVSWPQVASFGVGRYIAPALDTAPYTRLDINLKDLENAAEAAETTVMTLQSNGNVGIGVTDPDELLELYKVGTQLKLSGGAADYATFAVAADGAMTITTVDADAAEADIILSPDGYVVINSNVVMPAESWIGPTATAGVYFKDGNIGFGTITPASNVEVAVSAGSNASLWLSDADVAHPFTAVGFAPEIQADVLGAFINYSGTAGGMQVLGFSDTDSTPLGIFAHIGDATPAQPAIAVSYTHLTLPTTPYV